MPTTCAIRKFASIEILPGHVVLTSSEGVKILVDRSDRRQPIVEALHFRNYEKTDAAMLYALTPPAGRRVRHRCQSRLV